MENEVYLRQFGYICVKPNIFAIIYFYLRYFQYICEKTCLFARRNFRLKKVALQKRNLLLHAEFISRKE